VTHYLGPVMFSGFISRIALPISYRTNAIKCLSCLWISSIISSFFFLCSSSLLFFILDNPQLEILVLLQWNSYPKAGGRWCTGYYVIVYLGILTFLFYLLKRKA